MKLYQHSSLPTRKIINTKTTVKILNINHSLRNMRCGKSAHLQFNFDCCSKLFKLIKMTITILIVIIFVIYINVL